MVKLCPLHSEEPYMILISQSHLYQQNHPESFPPVVCVPASAPSSPTASSAAYVFGTASHVHTPTRAGRATSHCYDTSSIIVIVIVIVIVIGIYRPLSFPTLVQPVHRRKGKGKGKGKDKGKGLRPRLRLRLRLTGRKLLPPLHLEPDQNQQQQ